MMPICPKCDSRLVILDFEGIEIDVCAKCRGMWFDSGELEQVMEQTGSHPGEHLRILETAPGDTAAPGRCLCPRCDAGLDTFSASAAGGESLLLDRCPRGHGIWFDENELRDFLAGLPSEVAVNATMEFLNRMLGVKPESQQP
jgi:hypothetical protein